MKAYYGSLTLFWQNWIIVVCISFSLWQSVSEKHKINVPETMNEYLDMSDDEGTWHIVSVISSFPHPTLIITNNQLLDLHLNKKIINRWPPWFLLYPWFVGYINVHVSMHVCLNHTARANVPDILRAETFSDVDEGICLRWCAVLLLGFFHVTRASRTHPTRLIWELTNKPSLYR